MWLVDKTEEARLLYRWKCVQSCSAWPKTKFLSFLFCKFIKVTIITPNLFYMHASLFVLKPSVILRETMQSRGCGWSSCLWKNSAVPMGVLDPGSAHAWPSTQPPMTPSEFCQRTCLGGRPFHLKLFAKFQNPRTTPSGRKECGREEQ